MGLSQDVAAVVPVTARVSVRPDAVGEVALPRVRDVADAVELGGVSSPCPLSVLVAPGAGALPLGEVPRRATLVPRPLRVGRAC